MRNIRAKVLLTTALLSALFAGCHKSAAPLNSANVMFVNGCVSASTISVKANSTGIDGASGIGFLMNSGYKYVTAGYDVNLTFFAGGASTAFANRTENLTAPYHYSAFIGGTVSNPVYAFTTDDLTAPSKGDAKLRFVNLSPDNVNETVTANDSILVQGVGLGNISPFQLLRAGKYALGVFDPTDVSISVTTDSLDIKAGKIYTVVLTGSQAYTGASGLLLTFVDNN